MREKAVDAHDKLIVERRVAMRLAALAVITGFLLFVVGYFLGKKHAVSEFMSRIEHESLADQVYSSLQTMYELSDNANERSESTDSKSIEEVGNAQKSEEPQNVVAVSEIRKQYYLQIRDFSTQKSAQALVHRLKQKGVMAHIKVAEGTTQSGKKYRLYQVVSDFITDKQEAEKLALRIKQQEKLKKIPTIKA